MLFSANPVTVRNRSPRSAGDPPAFVDLMQGRPFARNSARPGFLGAPYKPFRPDVSHLFKRELEEGMKGELARLGEHHRDSLALVDGLNPQRLDTRLRILERFDKVRAGLDNFGSMAAADSCTQRTASILTSGKVGEALDLTREDPRVLARFTPSEPISGKQFGTAEGPLACSQAFNRPQACRGRCALCKRIPERLRYPFRQLPPHASPLAHSRPRSLGTSHRP